MLNDLDTLVNLSGPTLEFVSSAAGTDTLPAMAAKFSDQAAEPTARRDSLYEVWRMKQPAAGLFLLYGHPQVLVLSQKLACKYLLQEENLIILDGGNVFNPYLISELAQKAGRAPEDFLRRIRISRSFTCHQMLSLIRKAQNAATQWKSSFILLLGPLTTFYDESVPDYEARTVFHSFRQELHRLTDMGFRLLLACQRPTTPTRRTFVQQLKASALGIASCWEVERTSSKADRRLLNFPEAKDLLIVKMEKPSEPGRQWVIRKGEKLNPRYLPL